jgi:opacity protein-like surface antigen
MRASIVSAILIAGLSSVAHGQATRDAGWEFGIDGVYQDAVEHSFEGGARADFHDDFGLSAYVGYRFNNRFELQFGLDWAIVDYDVTLQSDLDPNLQFNGDGDIESFTPKVSINFNLLDRPLTPFLTAGAGWAFVDTNIPNGPVEVGCWWDPWWGYTCLPYQSTKSFDDPAYQVGLGVRWDFNDSNSLRLLYERHWLDYSNASSTPDFDQLKFGVAFQF